jgi:hypothetical protein
MKKIKLNIGVLKLKRSEISNLNNSEMKNIVGGVFDGDTTVTPRQMTDATGCPNITSQHC